MDDISKNERPKSPTQRFSNRVTDYVKFRPSYPTTLLDFMNDEFGIDRTSVIADVGSGTGIFTELLLERGATVYAVEPNAEMREAAEELLSGYENFRSVSAPAEQTGLAVASVDLVCAATAFHWFDARAAKTEWKRILRPQGTVFLVWNVRRAASPFLNDYENMLKRFAEGYDDVKHRDNEESGSMEAFFSPNSFKTVSYPNEQFFDFDGLKGRLQSSSYAPLKGNPNHEPMMAELKHIFQKHQRDGKVKFEYDTRAYFGTI